MVGTRRICAQDHGKGEAPGDVDELPLRQVVATGIGTDELSRKGRNGASTETGLESEESLRGTPMVISGAAKRASVYLVILSRHARCLLAEWQLWRLTGSLPSR